MNIKKRDGRLVPYDAEKIYSAIEKAFQVTNIKIPDTLKRNVEKSFNESLIEKYKSYYDIEEISVEEVQDLVEEFLFSEGYRDVYKAYVLYREQHKESRIIRQKLDFMDSYSSSSDNASTSSNTDPNANTSFKNVSTLESEVYKDVNRIIQRQRMKDKLTELYPEVANEYEKDLNNNIIYTHDEASSPVPKAYCGAYTTYPLMTEGVGNMDGITPTPPNDIQSFCGQVTNLVFILSAQTKGAVALGDFFVSFNYYIVKEFGELWYNDVDKVIYKYNDIEHKMSYYINKGIKQFLYGINQPAGNRGYQSPFTNVQICDKYYFDALFNDFYYPDGSKPKWEQIDKLQKIFIETLRKARLLKPLTFPVSTYSLIYNDEGYLDKSYEDFCAREWAEGSSHFLYHSNNPDTLSSCCRVQNKLDENVFTSTTGMLGLMTGSCNVITLNINRIVQDVVNKKACYTDIKALYNDAKLKKRLKEAIKDSLVEILNRVYKYHIAYKTILYDLEERGMITYSTNNYLYIKKLYSTIGVIGYYEAAKFLKLDEDSREYTDFQSFILNTISEENKKHSIYSKKKPFIFNLECIPGESLAVKFYNKDKADGYFVPEDQNMYNSYFFNPWKEQSILKKLELHGGDISKASNGGQGCHINLKEHLTKEQYKQLMKHAREVGCNYFTFNIPMSECKNCRHVINAPIKSCPKCNSDRIKYYTRIIGYLTPVDNWSKERQEDFNRRYFGNIEPC